MTDPLPTPDSEPLPLLTPQQIALQVARIARVRSRALAKAEREATLEFLEGGAKVYKDSLPGTGWVLERPTGVMDWKGRPTWHPKRYLATKEQAIAHYESLRLAKVA